MKSFIINKLYFNGQSKLIGHFYFNLFDKTQFMSIIKIIGKSGNRSDKKYRVGKSGRHFLPQGETKNVSANGGPQKDPLCKFHDYWPERFFFLARREEKIISSAIY